jgi:hypothetical protein
VLPPTLKGVTGQVLIEVWVRGRPSNVVQVTLYSDRVMAAP